MDKMKFAVDKSVVVEGDVVEISWQCEGCDRAELSIDNGYRLSTLEIATSGSKRFRLNRSKGRTRLTLTAYEMDRKHSKTLKVRVKEMPVTHAEEVDHRGRTVGKLRGWWQRLMSRMQLNGAQGFAGRYRAAQAAMPMHKRLASKVLLFVAVITLISIVFPRLISLLLLLLCAYLVWVVYRK